MPEVIVAGTDATPHFHLNVNGIDSGGLTGVAITLTDEAYGGLMESHLADNTTLTPLVFLTVPTITGTAQDTHVLTAHEGTYNNTPVTVAWQWKSNGTNVGTNAATYTCVTGDVGHTITVVETTTDTLGTVTTSTSVATAAVIAA